MRLPRLFLFNKSRKYPIKRDREGRSLRARCFEYFDQGRRPVEVAEELNMQGETAFKYFGQWRQRGPNFDKQYAFTKDLFRKTNPYRGENVELFAKKLGITIEQFETILSKPQGLKQLLTGKLQFPVHADTDHKRHKALELAILFSEHLTKHGGQFQDIYLSMKRCLNEYSKYHQEQQAAILENNQFLKFLHKLIAVDMEKERKVLFRAGELTPEEREHILQWGAQQAMKGTEINYWLMIAAQMAEGNTPQEAHAILLKRLTAQGNLKAAKVIQMLWNRAYPPQANAQETSHHRPQPPSPG